MPARSPFTPLVQSLPATVPFVGPETQERRMGRRFAARIGANESVFGPSPATIAAMREAVPEVWKYADPENFELRTALAKHHGVGPDNIAVGEGIDGLLGYLAHMIVREGTPVVTSQGAYPTFNYHIACYGGRFEFVPYRGDREDPEALIARAIETSAPLIYFANPDNPMGSWSDAEAVQGMIDAVPDGAVLCLDEAYIEFAPDGVAPPIDVANPRVIRFRTFSKAYGMAGARVGYGIAHEDIALAFNKVRNHFGINRVAQIGAMAALGDQEWLSKVRGWVGEARNRIGEIAAASGLSALPSATNFVTVDCGRDGVYAKRVVEELGKRGIFVRMPFAAPQNRCIRISAGKPADLDALAEALPDALRAI
ncbi:MULTISPECIES: pyridoxal phosphate-dependent aminotransferase [Rhodomicrobium]|uniref:pyridoxal phosphate-dependent aminotransferase n=1 Tax=Rhodomicrobium TaxID=1068 RepID=UPI000B4A9071|nr:MULTISPECIES: pyridoxal phosphate-dependent aminotransferase [Rhodomicrobium]